METAAILDFDRLLAPIAGEKPTGPDLREDASPASLYLKIRDARGAARAAERAVDAGNSEESGLLQPWRVILETAPGVIAEQSKDLEVAAWLCEALLRAYGIAGLRDGFRLSADLVEHYWDDLYPMPDEDGIETRVAPFSGLNGGEGDGTLIQPIRKVPITEGIDPGPYALWHYQQAADLLQLGDPDKVQARVNAGAATMEMIQNSLRQTPPGFYVNLVDDLEACLAQFARLNAAFDAKAGRDGPPASKIRNTLIALQDAVKDIARDVLAVAAPAEVPAEEAGAAAPASGGAAVAVAAPAGAITTRDDAFRMMLKVAEYFRKNEPQSPVSYVIEEAVRRAKLPLPELLAELIPDSEARRLYFLTAGIRPPES